MSEIKKLIQEAPYASHIKALALAIEPTISALQQYDAPRLAVIRHKLGQLKATVPGTEKALLICIVLYVLRRVGPDPRYLYEEKHNHRVSDHAFCSALRRLGADLSELKDGVKTRALSAGLIPIYDKHNRIRTFLPREAA